jgi:hypothetical protein
MSYGLYRLDDEYRFWRLGIRSAMNAAWGDTRDPRALGLPRYDYHGYAGTQSYKVFRTLMTQVVEPDTSDVFLDYGSGLGRAVFMAATLPFRRVIGIEYSAELSSIASTTLSCIRDKLPCKEVELIHGDAIAYEVPRDVTVIYFVNPFGGNVLVEVVKRIKQSLLDFPRNLRIVYFLPGQFDQVIDGCDWLVKRTQTTFPVVSDERFAVYESAVSLKVRR